MSPCPCPHCRALHREIARLRFQLALLVAQADAAVIDEIWGDVSPSPDQAERILREALGARDRALDPLAPWRAVVEELDL